MGHQRVDRHSHRVSLGCRLALPPKAAKTMPSMQQFEKIGYATTLPRQCLYGNVKKIDDSPPSRPGARKRESRAEEKLMTAILDHQLVHQERQNFDPAGHYARPDVLQLRVNRQRQSILKLEE